MSHARMVAPSCWPFELFPLNELYRGKLVHFITLKHTLRYFHGHCRHIRSNKKETLDFHGTVSFDSVQNLQ